jgi:hypothetical protein
LLRSPRSRKSKGSLSTSATFACCTSTICYAIMLPVRESAFRVGFWLDCCRENTEIGPLAGRRPAGEPISALFRQQSGQNPARKADFRPGSIIALHYASATLTKSLYSFALLCFALLCFALLCFALLCAALLCFALPCFALLCST